MLVEVMINLQIQLELEMISLFITTHRFFIYFLASVENFTTTNLDLMSIIIK